MGGKRGMRMVLGAAALVVLLCINSSFGALTATSSYFDAGDKDHARKILAEAFASSDAGNIHYGSVGLKRLGESLPKAESQCKAILTAASDPKATAESLYHATIAHKTIGTCQQPLPVINIVKVLNAYLAKEANLQELFFASKALVALDQKPADAAKLLKAIQALLKKNDSLVNYGYFFHIAGDLSGDAAKSGFTRIEDALVQADEVDSKFLQYEGGLSTTALIVNGIFHVVSSVNKAPPLTNEQTVKFANYFLSRSYVQTAKGIANLLSALINLSTNKYQVPIAVSLASSPAVAADQAKISVKVSDILGKELGAVTVSADSVTKTDGDVVIASKKKFAATSDKTIFTLDLTEGRPERGSYKVSVSASLDKADSRFPAAAQASVSVILQANAAIEFVDVGTVDADQTSLGKLTRVPFGKEADKVIEGDAQQKIQMRFTVKDKATGKLMAVHQAFLRFYKTNSAESAIFIAEPDSSGHYRLDLDIGSKSGDFGFASGEYNAELIIGDSLLVNSFSWKIGRFNLKLSGEGKPAKEQCPYKPRPEIKHMFREPEKRPLKFVSDLFSILAALPLVILLILWARISVNVSNLTISLWTLLFHLGLGGIFLLFGLFWLRINMFETVRYLIAIGLVTFFAGNKLLRSISERK